MDFNDTKEEAEFRQEARQWLEENIAEFKKEYQELIKNYKNSKNMMKASKGRQMQGFLRKLGMG